MVYTHWCNINTVLMIKNWVMEGSLYETANRSHIICFPTAIFPHQSCMTFQLTKWRHFYWVWRFKVREWCLYEGGATMGDLRFVYTLLDGRTFWRCLFYNDSFKLLNYPKPSKYGICRLTTSTIQSPFKKFFKAILSESLTKDGYQVHVLCLVDRCVWNG